MSVNHEAVMALVVSVFAAAKTTSPVDDLDAELAEGVTANDNETPDALASRTQQRAGTDAIEGMDHMLAYGI